MNTVSRASEIEAASDTQPLLSPSRPQIQSFNTVPPLTFLPVSVVLDVEPTHSTRASSNHASASLLGDACPSDVLHLIFSHLDALSLGRISRVCKRWRSLSSADHLWLPHIAQQNKRAPQFSRTQLAPLTDLTYSGYVTYMRRLHQLRHSRKEASRVLAEGNRRVTTYGFALQTIFHDLVQCLLLVMCSVLVALKLDRVLTCSWHLVAAPLYLALLILLVRWFSHAIGLRTCFRSASPYVLSELPARSLCNLWFMKVWDMSDKHYAIAASVQLVLLAACIVMIFARAQSGSPRWVAVFAPLWVAYALLAPFVAAKRGRRSRPLIPAAGLLNLLAPIVVFTVLLSIYDGRESAPAAWKLSAPLWAGAPATLVLAFAIPSAYLSMSFALCTVGVQLLLPGICAYVFIILAALKLDGHYHHDWRRVFIPIWVGWPFWIGAFFTLSTMSQRD